jgi:hypothetical protein
VIELSFIYLFASVFDIKGNFIFPHLFLFLQSCMNFVSLSLLTLVALGA